MQFVIRQDFLGANFSPRLRRAIRRHASFEMKPLPKDPHDLIRLITVDSGENIVVSRKWFDDVAVRIR